MSRKNIPGTPAHAALTSLQWAVHPLIGVAKEKKPVIATPVLTWQEQEQEQEQGVESSWVVLVRIRYVVCKSLQ